jgi:predicted unusual protein kinase regulating ubiquinone biosynthesis (AarF/ABC1/UbiB family)
VHRVKESSVPGSRIGRLGHFGRLAGGIAGGMVSEGLRRLANGERPSRQDLLLNSGNIQRVTDRLAELRGAAMKVGQLLSMEAGDFLPREFTTILARLRDSADVMPLGEVARVLKGAWGPGWETRFRRFDFKPVAAASIGQVHRAETRDGRVLAIKVQYPGVKASIDSDVDNVATLLRVFGLLPPGIDIAPLLAEARRQLHEEADYVREAAQLERYRQRLADRGEFVVPAPVEEWLTADVLPMSYLPGVSIDTLDQAPADLRNRIAAQLVELALTEVLQWGLVQTDPNFANFRYDEATGRIGLLDFGAMRDYSEAEMLALRALLAAARLGDTARVEAAARDVGYIAEGDPQSYRTVISELVAMAAEPARFDGAYDFGTSDLAQRMTEKVLALRVEQRFARLPPPAILFLHRKIAGTYLLCARLKARVEIAPLLERALTECVPPSLDQMRCGEPESLRAAG